MKLANLDLDTLRTLVVANDLKGYGQAGQALGRSASAISLQMKRLQADVGAPLFRKSGRGLELTEAGEIVLRYARRILALNDELLGSIRGASLMGSVRLGMSQDFADALLPRVLARFSKLYPLVTIEVRIEGAGALADAIEAGHIDIALMVGQADRPAAKTLGALDLVWIAGEGFRLREGQPLPLVLLGPQCTFRKCATEALDRLHRSWRIAALSPSLGGLWASASGGLGVTVRTPLGLPSGLVWGRKLFGLPELGSFPVTVHVRHEAGETVARLNQIITEAVGQALRPDSA